jgi:hypothetical protein
MECNFTVLLFVQILFCFLIVFKTIKDFTLKQNYLILINQTTIIEFISVLSFSGKVENLQHHP